MRGGEMDIGQFVRGKRIVITGGTGSFGRQIVARLLPLSPAHLTVFSRDENKQHTMRLYYEGNPTLDFAARVQLGRDSPTWAGRGDPADRAGAGGAGVGVGVDFACHPEPARDLLEFAARVDPSQARDDSRGTREHKR